MNFIKNYPYTGIPLASSIAKTIILDLYANEAEPEPLDVIVKEVPARHAKLGGSAEKVKTSTKIISLALQQLPNASHRLRVDGVSYWQ